MSVHNKETLLWVALGVALLAFFIALLALSLETHWIVNSWKDSAQTNSISK